MRGPIRSILLAALAVCAFAALTVGQASAATLKETVSGTAFQAIYGSPAYSATLPIGGGLGKNFGFGANMLFEADTFTKIGENLDIELEGKIKAEASESFIGGTLSSNKTGENLPLSFVVQFCDFQDNTVSGTATQSYCDTNDRPWISEICAPGAEKCRVDPLFEVGATKANVKIEDVSFDLGGVVVQGTVWGEWINGKAKECPMIKLVLPPAKAGADQNLIVTSPAADVGLKVVAVSGKACLISANNYWFSGQEKPSEPAIEITNE
ncbi:MAG: hypothetical protein ABSG93_01520 [Solirubrobacteraceae bacterium]|jgi:hypothetical protein